jgi:hypothetical protein
MDFIARGQGGPLIDAGLHFQRVRFGHRIYAAPFHARPRH